MSTHIQSLTDQLNGLPMWAKAIIGTTTAVVTSYGLWSYNSQRKSPYKTEYKNGLVYLYQFPRCKFAPSMSPVCLKLETWLRIAGIKYENVPIPLTLRSKEGTLPFVELNGQEHCDSGFAIRDLTALFNKENLDDQLTYEQKAVARAFEQMVENSTLWSLGRVKYLEKWNDHMTESIAGPDFAWFSKVPFVRWSMQSSIRKRMIAHGIGKHSDEEIDGIGFDDIKAVANYLGDKPFFMGGEPHRIDAVLFGALSQIVFCPVETKFKKFIEENCPNLIGFCDRIKEKFWPDWNEICENGTLNTPYILNA